MGPWQTLDMRRRPLLNCCLALLFFVLAAFAISLLAQSHPPKPPIVALTSAPEPVYAQDPNDAWNRIFYFLFSRRMEVRLSDEFPEGAPFTKEGIDLNLIRVAHGVSTGTFERNEVGDRAIDPLYPSSLDGTAVRMVLSDPIYSEFTKALHEALDEQDNGKANVPRSLIARALMQSDLWAAHDIFFNPLLPADEKELGERRRVAIDLLARLIRKFAPTPAEIKSLPDNYSSAMRHHPLPDLFRKNSGWIEVQWFPGREHDNQAGYRRVSRIFLKPTHPARNMQKFLNARPRQNETPATDLDGVALVMQLLVIDTRGNVRPTKLTTDVEVRRFERTSEGTFKRTAIQVCEISRKIFLRDPGLGGLVEEEESSPAYVGGHSFASNYFPIGIGQFQVGPPVQIKLRTRCAMCHRDSNLTQVRTFSTVMPPHPPRVKQLDPAANQEADFDIAAKRKRDDFQSLLGYFGGVSATSVD
jgi:hypothetical protein